MADYDSDNEEDNSYQPSRSKRLKTGRDDNVKRLIIVLENAQLETAKVDNKNYELLSSDKHMGFLKKAKKDPVNYRPDITHQCLLMLLDSPLNRAGHLQVYIHTSNHVLIYISPQTRIPRTYDRFAGLMVQLLHKLKIRAADSSQVLMKVIKNPVQSHFPIGIKKYSTSFHAPKLADVKDIVPQNESVCVVIGAMAHGAVNVDYCEQEIKISNYPLSAALTCTKICSSVEELWKIV